MEVNLILNLFRSGLRVFVSSLVAEKPITASIIALAS